MSDKVFQAIAELIAERNDSNPAEVTRDTRFQMSASTRSTPSRC